MQNNRILRGESFYQRYGISPEGLEFWLDQSDYRSYGDNQNWHDLSGNSRHVVQATASKQPVISGVSGFAGMGRDFDGVDDAMSTANNYVAGLDGMSAVVWFKIKAVGSGYDRLLSLDTWNPGFILAIVPTVVKVYLWDDGEDTVFGTTDVDDDTIHMAGFSWNVDGTGKIFVDGALDGSKATTVNTTVNANGKFQISYPNTAGIEGFAFIALFFSRTLADEEFQRLYLADAPRFGLL